MGIQHKKEYGVYHWDTFDNVTLFVTKDWNTGEKAEFDSLEEANEFVRDHYGNSLRKNGADRVDIVDSKGNIVRAYNCG